MFGKSLLLVVRAVFSISGAFPPISVLPPTYPSPSKPSLFAVVVAEAVAQKAFVGGIPESGTAAGISRGKQADGFTVPMCSSYLHSTEIYCLWNFGSSAILISNIFAISFRHVYF